MQLSTNRFFLFLFILISLSVNSQTTISQARLQALNSSVTIRGIITNGSEIGIIRYIQDPTGGLAIYSSSFASQLNIGDSIEVSGTLVEFSGLLEINPVTNLLPVSVGNALPQPQVVSPSLLSEQYESELVRLNGVIFGNGGSLFAANTSYGFSSGLEQSTIYVRTGSPLIGQMIPFGAVDLIGICSQFNSAYQVLPRDISDFILQTGINITSPVSMSNIQQDGIQVNWETNIPGTSEVAYGLTPGVELGLLSNPSLVASHSIQLTGLQAGQVYYFQIFSSANGTTATGPVKVFGTQSNSQGWIRTYFNHPVDTSNGIQLPELAQIELLDDSLIAYLNRAEESIDLTIYDFDNTQISSISTAINDAHNRGVRVRFISDGNNVATNLGVNDLLPAIPKLLSPVGGNYTIMHNKFVVIDADHSNPNKPIVWTGSTNWTDRQINRDPNNVIVIQDQTLARTYQLEFEEMWGGSGDNPDSLNARFGASKQDNTPHEFIVGGNRLECYFSPSDNTNEQLIKTLLTANDSVHFATMLVTRFDIANAIDTLINNGVQVAGIINSDSTTTVYSDLLASMGNQLQINPDTHVIMHHKFFVADAGTTSDPVVWTGSHNWSTNANTKNDENSLVIHNSEVADWYRRAFTRLTNPIPVDTTGVEDLTSKNGIKLYPSLVENLNEVRIISTTETKSQILLLNNQGQILINKQVVLSANSQYNLDFLPHVDSGVYFIHISNKSQSFIQKIIVVQ
ncbi:MAG TPA: phospholipase D-like domain-containing protein [Flavobacteriales bacterium]|nr:phospholipase D-like domain-containing protein [Flavobacteriales bacterium]